MEVFLNNITSFPVVVFTFLMAIICCYWILALIGAVDIDMFDIDTDIEIGVDVDTDIDVGTDVDMDTDVDAEGLGGVTGFMLKWGLTGIPVTVVISVLVATSWLLCYVVVSVVYPYIPWESIKNFIGMALIIICFMISIPLTALLIKPFKGIFVSHSAVKKASLIGMECVVKTGSVTSTFGQADMEDGGAGMLLDVRADEAYGIKKGDLVVLIDYNEDEGCYQVKKID